MQRNKKTKILMAFALLMLSAILVIPVNALIIRNSILATPLSPQPNYGNIMQYEWTTGGGSQYQDDFSAGPAPDTPNVLWSIRAGGSGYISVFDGKAFVINGATLTAYNAFTGDRIWNTTLLRSASGTGGTTKIDNNYLFVDCSGPEVHRISDGAFVANFTVPYWGGMGGGAQYFPGSYSSDLKMKYGLSFDNVVTKQGYVNAISLADPTHPVLAWQYTCTDSSEISSCGGDILCVGTTAGVVYALDGKNGTLLWRAPKTGAAQQHGLFYDGNFYESASSPTITCWNNATGDVQWEYDLAEICSRAFGVYNGAAGYGRVYYDVDGIDPHSWVGCWDAKTGALLWKQPAYYNIAYNTPALGGGKLYTVTCDQAAGRATSTLAMPGYRFTCFDAFTGEELWSIPQTFATPSIAYGNLYGIYGGVIYCIGQQSSATTNSPKDWNFGFEGGNLTLERVAQQQAGPRDLSQPRWIFSTGGKISSSAAVVAGKVYIGSEDDNWYCLDAYTGAKIWNFTTGYLVGASAAVVNGRVYTGADDGNIYCLDANTGAKIWQTYAGGLHNHIIMPQELQSRSSPIVIGSYLYVGALDGKVYCLNTNDGSTKWTYQTGDAIGGSPAYYNGAIYIASTDRALYCLDASTGAFKFKTIDLNLDVPWNSNGAMTNLNYFNTPTPVVVNGVIYVAGGVTMGGRAPGASASSGGANGGGCRAAAFNATTGASIWNQTLGGNSGSTWTPTYYNGNLYMVEFMQVTCMSATAPGTGPARAASFMSLPAGNRTWCQWIGYEILSSVAYVDDLRGPAVYVGSDVGSVTCLNATSGKAISAYQTPANIEASPTIWDGKLYIGSEDRNIYCFDDSPIVDFTLHAASNKGDTMWNNETLTIAGNLKSNPHELAYDATSLTWTSSSSDLHPGLPNATIIVTFTKPDMTSFNVTTTTDNMGLFSLSYSPDEVGSWGWVAYYAGQRTTGLTYNPSFTQWNPIDVTATPVEPTPTPTAVVTPTPIVTPTPTEAPTPTETASPNVFGMSTMYAYIIVAVVVLVVVAVAAYAYTRRKKIPK